MTQEYIFFLYSSLSRHPCFLWLPRQSPNIYNFLPAIQLYADIHMEFFYHKVRVWQLQATKLFPLPIIKDKSELPIKEYNFEMTLC